MSTKTPNHNDTIRIYPVAVCPRYQSLALVMATRPDASDLGIGWWRCHLCLEWHIYLVSA